MTASDRSDTGARAVRDTWLNIGLGLMAGLMALSVWLSLTWTETFEQVRRASLHRAGISAVVSELFTCIQDAQIGEQAFLLTGRPEHLQAYRLARDRLPQLLERFGAMAHADASLREPSARVNELAQGRIAEIEAVVELAERGDQEGAMRRILAEPRDQVSRLATAVADIQHQAELDRRQAVTAAERSQRRLHLSIVFTSILSLVFAFFAIFVLVRSNRRQSSDIARRITIEDELRASEARNRAFFELTDDYLFIVERDGDGQWRYDTVNPNAERLFGRSAESFAGQPVSAVNGPAAGERSVAAFERCRASAAGLRYDNTVDLQGASYMLDVSLMPLPEPDGEVRRIMGSARDVTAARQTEMALAQSQKLEAIGQLTGGVAHDFNNVLQVVLGNLELALRGITDEKVQRRLNAAMAAAVRGQRLTGQLLSFARRQPMAVAVIDPSRALAEIESVVRTSVGDRISLDWRLAPDSWPVRLDQTQLENAVINLVINARDAMPEGGRLEVETANVTLDLAEAATYPEGIPGQHVRIRVSDTGTGIPPELMSKVFQPFFTTKPAGKGTGLGLAMVHGFVRQAGGFTVMDSEPGRGTAISLFIPRSGASDEPAPPAPEPEAAARAGRGERVLVVEDEAEVRAGAVEHLRAAGYLIEEAADAAAALARLGPDGGDAQPVDLLLTDIVLPGGMTGVDLARRAQASRPQLAVLFMTGHATEPTIRDAVTGGDALLLRKPFRQEQLSRMVRSALDGRQRRAASFDPASDRVDFRPAATGNTVLLVEDDALVRAVAVDALTAAGYRCIETGLAAEALAVLGDPDVLVSLVVTDLGLPDMEGQRLLAEARTLRPGIPALICSGYGARDALASIVDAAAGRTEALGKPYSPEMLVRLVGEMLTPPQPSTPQEAPARS